MTLSEWWYISSSVGGFILGYLTRELVYYVQSKQKSRKDDPLDTRPKAEESSARFAPRSASYVEVQSMGGQSRRLEISADVIEWWIDPVLPGVTCCRTKDGSVHEIQNHTWL